MKPLLSVCILSQNHEDFVEDLVRSLSIQTLKNFEVLYLDNCSSDNTFEYMSSLFETYEINVSLSIKNTKPYSIPCNLNRLIKNANGEFIMIISADDWLTPESVLTKITYLQDNPQSVAVSSAVYIYNHQSKEERVQYTSDGKSGNQFEALMLGEISFNAPGAVYRKSCLYQVGFFDENIEVEDFDMWLKLSLIGEIGCIQTPLAYYRRHSSNISINNTKSTRWIANNVLKSMNKYRTHPVFDKAIAKLYCRIFISQVDVIAPQTFLEKVKALLYVLRLGKKGWLATGYFFKGKLFSFTNL